MSFMLTRMQASIWLLETILTATLIFTVFCATDSERGQTAAHIPVCNTVPWSAVTSTGCAARSHSLRVCLRCPDAAMAMCRSWRRSPSALQCSLRTCAPSRSMVSPQRQRSIRFILSHEATRAVTTASVVNAVS